MPKSFQSFLFASIAPFFMVPSNNAWAADCLSPINTSITITSPCNLSSSGLEVTSAGSLSTTSLHSGVVQLTSGTSTYINNAGILSLPNNSRGGPDGGYDSSVIYISGSTLTNGILNSGALGTATGGSNFAVYINNSSINGGITNTSSGSISDGQTSIFLVNSQVSGGINNAGNMFGGWGFFAAGGSTVNGGFTNTGTLGGNINGFDLYSKNGVGTILNGGFNNSGTISIGFMAIDLQSGSTINGGFNNSGTITDGVATNPSSTVVIGSGATINGGINNDATGSIISIKQDAINTAGTIDSITNKGVINGAPGYHGINNTGNIGTLNNLQSGLTYTGILPTNYNIIIDSPSAYGKLVASSVTGALTWGVTSDSTIPSVMGVGTTYTGVFSGLTSANILNYNTKYYSSNYTVTLGIAPQSASPTTWDLTVNSVATGSLTVLASGISMSTSLVTTPNVVLNNSTLQAASASVGTQIYLSRNGGAIDQSGMSSIWSGVIGDENSGQSGNLAITNTAGTGGTVTLSAPNTYTGSTTINSGATLALSGAGSITQSSSVINNSIFNISGVTASSSSIQSLAGNGAVALGAKTLTITNGTDNFAGVIGGTGGLAITGGIQTLSGANTYSGATSIGSGSTLALSGTGSIAASSVVTNNGTFDISAASSGATVKAISGGGSVALGNKSLTIANASGNLSGTVGGAGGLNIAGGNQTLSGNNTYSGGTEVQSGANLSIASGSALGSGTLSLVGTSTVPATLTTTATTTIANSITVSGDPVFNVASGTTTTVSSPITDGASSGDVVVAGGGTLNLTAVNTYTGLTAIGAGSTLALSGVGSITPSSSVTNNGTFNVSGKTGNVSVANYTQGSAGTLALNVTPGATSKLNVAGTASLAGSLALTSAAGPYTAGSKYTLLTANGVTGTFGNLTSNLASYTRLAYGLAYDANDVYLVFTPNVADTQQSLVNSSQALQSTYTLQNSVLANSFSYDCNEFGEHGICISAGGRNTAVSAANGLNNTSALLIAAYKVHPQVRIGAYADQNLSMNNASSTVNLGNNTPLIGLFGAWNERLDGTGTEIKVSAAYGQKSATVTRQVVNTSEPGTGSANLNSQGAQITAKYGFAVMPEVIVSPYAGIRYTQNNMGGYTEATSSTVTTPLTYSALNTNATTALAGVGASYHFIPKATVYASAGVETDTNTANGTYSATGITGLTPINFNANPVKTRPTATLGAYYDVEKNQRVGINGIYRQEPYQGVSTTSVMMTYTVGL